MYINGRKKCWSWFFKNFLPCASFSDSCVCVFFLEKKNAQTQLYFWADSAYPPLDSLQNDGSAPLSVRSCWYPSSESGNALKPFSYNGVASLILPLSECEQVKETVFNHCTLTFALALQFPDYSAAQDWHPGSLKLLPQLHHPSSILKKMSLHMRNLFIPPLIWKPCLCFWC